MVHNRVQPQDAIGKDPVGTIRTQALCALHRMPLLPPKALTHGSPGPGPMLPLENLRQPVVALGPWCHNCLEPVGTNSATYA